MFLQVSVCPHRGGGMRGFIWGGVWFYLGGVHGFIRRGVHGFIRGGMCGFIRGACVVLFRGGMHGFIQGSVHGFIRGGTCVVFLDTMRYGQWAGGTHPTGMHSCLLLGHRHRTSHKFQQFEAGSTLLCWTFVCGSKNANVLFIAGDTDTELVISFNNFEAGCASLPSLRVLSRVVPSVPHQRFWWFCGSPSVRRHSGVSQTATARHYGNKWIVVLVTNLTVYFNRLPNHPIGRKKVNFPDYGTVNRIIASLEIGSTTQWI